MLTVERERLGEARDVINNAEGAYAYVLAKMKEMEGILNERLQTLKASKMVGLLGLAACCWCLINGHMIPWVHCMV